MVDWADYRPRDPEAVEWDVVVVGAGMGGGVLGLALSKMKLKVLFLERGAPADPFYKPRRQGRLRRLLDPGAGSPDLAAQGRWDKAILLRRNGRTLQFHAPMGNGPGGSSALYGAALERLRREDFDPVDHAHLPTQPFDSRWPIAYDDFLPYYRRAEALLGVRGGRDPSDPDDDARLTAPPALSDRDADLFEALATSGLAPYRLHVGIAYKPGCAECMGVVCPRDCKAEGASRGLRPALVDHGAKLLTGFTVDRLTMGQDRVESVVGRLDGKAIEIRGKVVVLAAGALNTPGILLASTSPRWPAGVGNDADLVGRGLMFHVSEFFALWPRRRRDTVGPAKTLSSRAMYIVDGRRLGGVQSVGIRVSVSMIASFLAGMVELNLPFRIPFLKLATTAAAIPAARMFRDAALLSTITEDFAYPDNRVVLDSGSPSGIALEYSVAKELSARVAGMRRFLSDRLKGARIMFLSSGDSLNYGHPSGTCRFGVSPQTSVLDPQNRVHGVENLYVADASFFPSSGGTNPSLTVAANALRVADIIGKDLSARAPALELRTGAR